jgi:hypothetical protein
MITENFKFSPGQTVTLGMGVAHHKPDPLGFERAAHVLFHVIENLLQGSFEIGLALFDGRTVTHESLSHSCSLASGERRVILIETFHSFNAM